MSKEMEMKIEGYIFSDIKGSSVFPTEEEADTAWRDSLESSKGLYEIVNGGMRNIKLSKFMSSKDERKVKKLALEKANQFYRNR